MMFDFITLTGLWFFTAGVSLLFHIFRGWKGGIYWFWTWNGISLVVIAWEIFLYLHWPLWLLFIAFAGIMAAVSRFVNMTDHAITLTRTVTKSGTGEPLALNTKLEGRIVNICFGIGGAFFLVHLWVW